VERDCLSALSRAKKRGAAQIRAKIHAKVGSSEGDTARPGALEIGDCLNAPGPGDANASGERQGRGKFAAFQNGWLDGIPDNGMRGDSVAVTVKLGARRCRRSARRPGWSIRDAKSSAGTE
jgi:hypothetical protein